VYSRRALLAAAYKLSDRSAVLVDEDGADRWVLYVVARHGTDVRPLLVSLIQELGDQALRDRLEEEFGAVRTLIVAQAFSEGNLLDPQRDDADHRLDPRGIEQRR
jgi:His-Xaa-Ser system protein HxsD